MTLGKPQHKVNSWSTIGSNIVALSGVQSEKKQLGFETTASKKADPRKPRPSFVRGIGLTPRFFDALMHAWPAPIEALSSTYLPAVSRHVESVAPSKQVFAQLWCPVIVEDNAGGRHVLHVDPLVVRKFRREVAEELQHVFEKRKRMLKRIHTIRQEFPQAQTHDVAARLRREIVDAQGRSNECLLQQLPESISVLHVFLEVTPYMLQLELVCQHLLQELPTVLASAGVRRISFSILAPGSSSEVDALPTLAPIDCQDPEAWSTAREWLLNLRALIPVSPSEPGDGNHGFYFEQALRWSMTSEAFDQDSRPGVLLLASSKPVDLEACKSLVRRSDVPLQMVGVFGSSPEDPEPGLQELAGSAASGSSFRLFFGPVYWSRFVTAREQQLQGLEERVGETLQECGAAGDKEVVSAKVFEMRLIERIMRECYAEEQHCEEELTCATRVFERTLIERDDLLAVLRGGNDHLVASSHQKMLPASARR